MMLEFLLLLLVGTLAGVDLVSGPQVLLARPIVVGTLAGLVLGDPASGVLVGGILELYALEVLPVGSTRYPDHGPGVVAAVWLTSQLGSTSAGYGVLVALGVAELGGWSLQRLRRMNGRALELATPALEAGEARVAAALQWTGLLRDALRSVVLTATGLLAARLLFPYALAHAEAGEALAALVLAIGLAGAVAGAVRTAGRDWRGVVLALALVAGWFLGGRAGVFPSRWGW
jgi:mannose/fructose/N-acetylgalactosamine-specific phosphotransferase system component IIC